MNAEWNTVRGETAPATIPGSLNMSSSEGLRGTAVSGRTALVGGFLKAVGAAHARFGRLPFARLFDTAIHLAKTGMPVTKHLAEKFGGEGVWVAISRDPKTGVLRAASHNRSNSAAVAW